MTHNNLIKSAVINFFAFFLSIILVTVFLPISIVILVPFIIYRQVVILLAQVFKKETLAKIVTSRSSLLISENIYNHPVNTLISLLLVEGVVDIQHLRREFQTKLLENLDPNNTGELKFPELQQNVDFWMGFPFWRKLPTVDLKKLIRFYNDDGE